MRSVHRLGVVLFAVIFTLIGCGPETVSVSPTPTTARSSAAPTTAVPTATPTRTPSPTPVATTAAPTPSATTPPGGSPNAACPARNGGSNANRAVITAIRVAHNPGFDRVVFELGPNAVGTYGLPPYSIEVASSFTATSGQPVRVDGNAFFLVRLSNTDAHDQQGRVTVASTDLRPATPLVKEVRIVEDFEAVNRWAIGLDRLVCPTVLTLSNPIRVVFDFPTPP